MKRVLIGMISIVVIIVVAIFSLSFRSRQIFDINSEDVSKITIFKGENGKSIEITEEKQIESITSNLNSVTYKKGAFVFHEKDGFVYSIKIFDNNGEISHRIKVNGESNVTYKKFKYKAIEGEINYNYIENLFQN